MSLKPTTSRSVAHARGALIWVLAVGCVLGLLAPAAALTDGQEGDEPRLGLRPITINARDALLLGPSRWDPFEGGHLLKPLSTSVSASGLSALRLSLTPGRGLKLAGFLAPGAPSAERAGGARARALQPDKAAFDFSRRSRSESSRALSYQADYEVGALRLQGSFLDVGAAFTPSDEILGTEANLEQIRKALGTRRMELGGAWDLAPGAELSSRYSSVRNDRPSHDERGLTTTQLEHVFALALGPSTRLEASVRELSKEWDSALGKPDEARRTSALRLNTGFGPDQRHSLQLALVSTDSTQGDQQKIEGLREVRLNLAPSHRLQLSADHITNTTDGHETITQQVGAVLSLASDSRLSAALKTLAPDSGSRTQESLFKLETALGGGATSGRLVAEQKTVRPESAPAVENLTANLTGNLGQTNLRASLEQQRTDAPDGALSRITKLHLDRALGARLKLSAYREEKVTGTQQRPETSVRSRYSLAADLGPETRLAANLSTQETAGAPVGSSRDISLEHKLGAASLRAVRREWSAGWDRSAVDELSLDLPMGDLPEWARSISHHHAFEDAHEYHVVGAPGWLDMPFAGLRLFGKRRQGGEDGHLDTTAIAYRSVIAGRYHLLVAHQRSPEATDGDRKGRPLALSRSLLEVGAPVAQGLVARARYGEESGLLAEESRRHSAALGLVGSLSEQERVEVSVARNTGQWEGVASDRASVSVLYAQRLDEEREAQLKLGYAWGREGETRSRDCRLDLRYLKPF